MGTRPTRSVNCSTVRGSSRPPSVSRPPRHPAARIAKPRQGVWPADGGSGDDFDILTRAEFAARDGREVANASVGAKIGEKNVDLDAWTSDPAFDRSPPNLKQRRRLNKIEERRVRRQYLPFRVGDDEGFRHRLDEAQDLGVVARGPRAPSPSRESRTSRCGAPSWR